MLPLRAEAKKTLKILHRSTFTNRSHSLMSDKCTNCLITALFLHFLFKAFPISHSQNESLLTIGLAEHSYILCTSNVVFNNIYQGVRLGPTSKMLSTISPIKYTLCTLLSKDLHSSGPASGSFGSSPGWPDSPSRCHHPQTFSHPQAPPLSFHSGPDLLCPVCLYLIF